MCVVCGVCMWCVWYVVYVCVVCVWCVCVWHSKWGTCFISPATTLVQATEFVTGMCASLLTSLRALALASSAYSPHSS